MTKTKILLVEDDKSLREIYGVRLYEEGYDIVSAGDGEEALAMAIKDRPNLIISDVMMPKISGFDMLDILRSTTETKNIKVIIMTALSSEEQRQRGVSLGADRYLVKSQVGIEDVVRTVHEILQDAPIAGQPVMVSRPSAPANRSAARSSAPIMPGLGARPAASVTMPPRTSAPEDESIQPQQTAQPAPVQSAPIPAPAPIPVAPVEQPQPQAQPQPQPAPVPQAPVQQSVLPEPIAPFSTPRINGAGTLADRVIQPIEQPKQDTPDMAQLMNQALAGEAQPAPVQSAPIPAPAPIPVAPVEQPQPQAQPQPQPAPVPQAPVQPNPSMVAPSPSPLSSQAVSFEETPRATSSPAGGSTTPPGAA